MAADLLRPAGMDGLCRFPEWLGRGAGYSAGAVSPGADLG